MGLFSGGGSLAQRKKTRSFSKITGADAEKYVDTHADLADAWKQMQDNPAGLQGSYWIQRMGGEFTKQAFGEAHRGEDTLLFKGTYAGGTAVKKADPTYFSAKSTMREDDKIGMRAAEGPTKVVKETEETEETSGSTTSSSTESSSVTNQTTQQINTLTSALSSALAAISAISQGYSATASSTAGQTTWPGAPDWVKNFTDYRKWLASKSQTTGYLSTLNTSSTGMSLAEMLENVNVTALTSG